MDQLETQVSDLRSFLGAAAAPTPPQGQGRPDTGEEVVSAASVASVVSGHDAYSPAPGPLRANSHHSSRSAPGDNSAPHHHHHPRGPQSPLDLRDGHGHGHAHAHVHAGSTSSSVGTVANNNAAKRRADDEEDDGPARQQRSKRNRVCGLRCVASCSRVAICVACHLSLVTVTVTPADRCVCCSTFRLHGESSRLFYLSQPASQPVRCDGCPHRAWLPSPSPPPQCVSLFPSHADGSRHCAAKQTRSVPDPFSPHPAAATSASDERSSAMARRPASGAATSICNASTPRTAAPTSRTRTSSATWPSR